MPSPGFTGLARQRKQDENELSIARVLLCPQRNQLGNPASDVLLKLNCLVDRKSEPILTIPNPKPGSRFLYRYFGLQF
jgi:hypothetical protein